MGQHQIQYSEKYCDDMYEYRHMWFFRLRSRNLCPRIDSSPKMSGVRLEFSRAVVGSITPSIALSLTSCSSGRKLNYQQQQENPAQHNVLAE